MRSSTRGGPRSFLAGLLLSSAMAGCAPASAPDPFRAATAPPRPSFDPGQIKPNEIGRQEILARGKSDLTAMALIRRLRPGWLTVRGQISFTDGASSYPIVYIDEVRHGGLPTLHGIPANEIQRLEFYSTADATTRWGTGHTAGVINVVTGRR